MSTPNKKFDVGDLPLPINPSGFETPTRPDPTQHTPQIMGVCGKCPYDTNGDGDCHLCYKRVGGCLYPNGKPRETQR